jgi:predicted chitinase
MACLRLPGVDLIKAVRFKSGKARGGGNTQSGDGPRFRGRGMLQITWRNTYAEYGTYRNKNFTTDPNPSLLATNAFDATDVAGWEWTHK